VRARSHELSLALGRLSAERNTDGSLAAGHVLAGRFVVAEPLGRGGMATVYLGIDRSTGERVAIKVIQASSSDQLDAMRRFIREVGVAARIGHPAVVRMFHVDVSDDGLLFQAQELVDGETLTSLAREWPAGEAARLGAVLCEALAAAHAHGIVHRDVKPDNVMLTASAPGLKLLDFGIAKIFDVAPAPGDATGVRMVVGTPGYMAPEQAHGGGEISDRADVYAVGVLLLQLTTGLQPSDPESALATAAPVLPAALVELIGGCLRARPEARPAAAAVARALAELADERAVPPLTAIVAPLLAAAAAASGSRRAPGENRPTTPHRRGNPTA
jgi:serine/threonine-protein kinase